MTLSLRSLLLAAALVLLAISPIACDDDSGGPNDTTDAADMGRGDGIADEDPSIETDTGIDTGVDTANEVEEDTATHSCNLEGFQVGFEYASTTGFGLQYLAASSTETPHDLMLVQRYDDFDGPTEPGTYDLTGINYRDCGLCLLAYSQCTGDSCDKTFYAEQGTVTIEAIGGLGDQFTATLNNVVFDEVTIDSSWVSTPVPGGESWCMDGYTFDQEIRAQDEAVCSRPDIACVGEVVSDFSLVNCASEELVAMSDLAVDKDALWLVAVAGWCSACRSWVPQVQSAYDTHAEDGLQVAFIMGEDGAYGEPTLSYCRRWAEDHDGDPALFYIDHDGTNSYTALFAHIWPYLDSDGAFLLPWNTVLDAQTFESKYADGAGGDLEDTIDELLGQ